jgi:hypothetical protein
MLGKEMQNNLQAIIYPSKVKLPRNMKTPSEILQRQTILQNNTKYPGLLTLSAARFNTSAGGIF